MITILNVLLKLYNTNIEKEDESLLLRATITPNFELIFYITFSFNFLYLNTLAIN